MKSNAFLVGSFDGEPDANYTSCGCPPTAYVQVGTSAAFTCTNTDTRTRDAETACWTQSILYNSAGTINYINKQTTPWVTYNGPMGQGEELPYSATALGYNYLSPGGYSATGVYYIRDGKTLDSFYANSLLTVTVH